MKLCRTLLATFAIILTALPAHADDYPSRPITLIVPFAAGGASDVIARVVADEMGKHLGQRLINENIPGAGGTTALLRAANAKPDGYTVAIGNAGTNAAAYTIYPDIKYKPDAFVPVVMIAKTSPLIAVKKDLPVKTLAEFIDYAKKNKGKVTLGHAGVGSSNYLICRSFVAAAGVDITLVGYRGGGPALNDLIGGQIDGVCDNGTSLAGAVENKQVNALVASGTTRIASMPDVPTSAEAGLPNFQAQGWNALFVPKGTPDDVIKKLNDAARKALASDTVKKRFFDLAATEPAEDELTPDYLVKFVPAEIEKYKALLK
ncbi:tripartite tricarboxylate transporter family receptor [Variibacter gotjawalensis]|uniref:Tripartite tricarboxylate transporter family receptor n=1 Tax=Variibacter gotjawalensis TaxID=1333996 RepID=A0A0S3PVA9_9BRAD|nr:tripartite tricarboxylate transporter substrate-binding protein [Variibacter gotjawalensis]NIK50084.1 tripartite-type tricarboxylate transporter receptor subunit TctC [Variibacter gotjawalensis]RZS46083.1 tripartite-type tricarboxylate transporter receptor subunit TctC [Variibacter gotjawalensis]BAT59758.1 tripartite tricarboxylate transporter family receptor [Variibacter gotjawalensis]